MPLLPQEVEWPDWEAMEATVRLDHFMGANEEFRLLRLAILATSTKETATLGGGVEIVPSLEMLGASRQCRSGVIIVILLL